eukprot:6306168-Amphidinium_carterae.1
MEGDWPLQQVIVILISCLNFVFERKGQQKMKDAFKADREQCRQHIVHLSSSHVIMMFLVALTGPNMRLDPPKIVGGLSFVYGHATNAVLAEDEPKASEKGEEGNQEMQESGSADNSNAAPSESPADAGQSAEEVLAEPTSEATQNTKDRMDWQAAQPLAPKLQRVRPRSLALNWDCRKLRKGSEREVARSI